MLYPEIDKLLNLLSNYGLAKMTGTGACCYISFSSEAEASRVSDQLPAEYETFVAKGINLSPTHKVLFRPSYHLATPQHQDGLNNTLCVGERLIPFATKVSYSAGNWSETRLEIGRASCRERGEM